MDIEEKKLLSSYAKSELVGGLILGEYARRAKDNFLRDKLIHHSAEEIRHASYITTLLEKNGGSISAHDEKGSHYYAKAGFPKSEIEVLAMTEAFEPVALLHYKVYVDTKGVSDEVKNVFHKIIKEESHAGWITNWLDTQLDKSAVDEARNRYRKVIEEVYLQELERLKKLEGLVREIAINADKYIKRHGLWE